MKKTFRKALVLTAVVTVMMVCALVLPASAEACHGNIETWTADIIAPTCTEKGYTNYYCDYCYELAYSTIIDDYPMERATGHRYLVTDYISQNGGEYYTRQVTCQNEVCKRENGDEAAVSGTVRETATKYYRVEFKNKWASPSLNDVTDHADYFLKGYYVKGVPATYIVDRTGNAENECSEEDYITKTYAPISRVNNEIRTDYGDNVTEPDFEYFTEEDGTVSLYVKEGAKAYADGKSAYVNTLPVRNNDTAHGDYKLVSWSTGWLPDEGTDISEKEIYENTTFYAVFDYNPDYTVTYTFKNGDKAIFESVGGIEYGSAATYDGETPKRAKTVEYTYEFAGWRVEDKNATDSEYFFGIKEPIPLYHQHAVIYAQYNAIPNRYNVELVKYDGSPFTYNGEPIIKQNVAFFEEIVSEEVVKTLDITRPNTETYTFKETGTWKISAVNGYDVVGNNIIVGLDSLYLPSSVTVKVENGDEITIGYEDYAMISVSPVYLSQYVTYPVTVSIMHNYFLEEDLYDNSRPRSDILDDFYVTAYELNNKGEVQGVLASGQTDSDGKVTLKIPFRTGTTWRFEAVTKNNKYFGYTVINPMAIDADSGKHVYEVIEIEGAGIAPSLSEGWSNGVEQSCSCVCHSFLSGLLLRIYNFIYRIFGIEYVCCDDLFAVHGDILIYD